MSLLTLMPSEKAQTKLRDFLSSTGLPQKSSFHSTILYTQESPIFRTDNLRGMTEELLPTTINPAQYSLKIFGEGDLVLAYRDTKIEDFNNELIQEVVRQCIAGYSDSEGNVVEILEKHLTRQRNTPIYLDFNPHITLSKNFTGNVAGIPAPDFPIRFDRYGLREEF